METKTAYGQNMLLYTTFWGKDKSFKLMPISNDCPYAEVLYDTELQTLVAFSKKSKQNFEMLPKLDDDGEFIPTKKPKRNGKPMKEQRILMNVPSEYWFIERPEQEAFIKAFAVNAKSFDYKKFLDLKPKQESNILQKEPTGLIDAKGKALTVAK